MEKALEIIKENKIYIKILKEVSLKYKSYERFTGVFTIKSKDTQEMAILQTFDDKVFENGKAKIKVSQVVKLFEGVLDNVSFLDFLRYVLNENIISNKELKNQEIENENYFYKSILSEYKNHDNSSAIKWFTNCVNEKKYGYNIVKKYYNECLKDNNLDNLKNTLLSILKAIDQLPYQKQEYKSIPIFATEITRNPHFFDRNQMGGTLLKYGISYILNERIPNNIRDLNALYYKVGLLKDEISNHTTIYKLKAYKDSKEVKAIKEYNLWDEPLQLSISNMLKIDSFECIDDEIFIFENPSVFEQVKLNLDKEKSLICTSGQLNLSSYMILDKISNLKKIYYAGDFDPEGIDIAYKIKERYKDKVEFLFYTKEIYMDIKSEENISDRRIKIIQNIHCEQLDSLIKTILESKKAAYQEMIISKYIEYINDK